MKRSTWLTGIGAALALAAGEAALAQTAAPAAPAAPPQHLNSQQQLMKDCAAEAKSKGVTGAARQSFMSSCLKSKGMSEADINKQQQKMKTCNADATAKGLKGDDRKAFMKTCLSAAG